MSSFKLFYSLLRNNSYRIKSMFKVYNLVVWVYSELHPHYQISGHFHYCKKAAHKHSRSLPLPGTGQPLIYFPFPRTCPLCTFQVTGVGQLGGFGVHLLSSSTALQGCSCCSGCWDFTPFCRRPPFYYM